MINCPSFGSNRGNESHILAFSPDLVPGEEEAVRMSQFRFAMVPC